MSEQNSNSENTDHGGHSDHPKPRYDDVNIPVVVLLGVLSAILTFVSICFVQGLYYQWEHSVVQADWNSRILTPQEQVIVDQKRIRDGFYETKNGEIYISVDAAAQKMLNSSEPQKPNEGDPQPSKSKEATKKDTVKPEPPGPDPGSENKAEPSKTEPSKTEAKQSNPEESGKGESKPADDNPTKNQPADDKAKADKKPAADKAETKQEKN